MAGEGDAERLVVLLEARVRDFERNMEKASGTATKNYGRMRKDSQTATQRMETDMARSTSRINQALASTSTRVGTFGKSLTAGFIAPIAGLLTLTAALSGTRAALNKFGDIADRATESGLDAEFFQGVAYQAKLAGVEFDTFSSAVATFAKNSGLAAEGKGKMVSQLKALNPELLLSIQHATTQEQRLRLAADALNSTADAAKKAALAAALFGDSGIILAKAFDGGSEALDRMVLKAKEMGLVVDRDLIARAEELGDELDTAAEIVDLKLKRAFIDLAPLMVDIAGWASEFARLMAIAYEQTKAIEDRQFLRPLQNQLAETYNAMGPVKDRIAEIEAALAGGGPNGMILKLDLADAQAKLATLEAQAMQFLTRVTELQGAPRGGGVAPAIVPSAPRSPNMMSGADLGILDLKLPDTGKIDAVATGFRGVRDAAEASAMSIATNTDAVDLMREQFSTAESMASSFASTIISGITGGEDAVKTLGDAFGQLGQQLLQMAADQAIKALFSNLVGIFGGSIAGGAAIPAGGFVPGLTGPKLFSSGGHVRGQGTGTSDSIPAMLSDGEFVVNAKSAARFAPLLSAINSGRIGAFASGGRVMPGGAGSVDCVIGATVTP